MDKTEIVNDVLLRLGSCCEPWARARRGGTDNEGYGTLIDADYEIGNGLPPVKFCPWCGDKKPTD